MAAYSRRPRSAARETGPSSIVRLSAPPPPVGVLQPGRACIAGIRSHGGGVRERPNVTCNTIPRRRP